MDSEIFSIVRNRAELITGGGGGGGWIVWWFPHWIKICWCLTPFPPQVKPYAPHIQCMNPSPSEIISDHSHTCKLWLWHYYNTVLGKRKACMSDRLHWHQLFYTKILAEKYVRLSGLKVVQETEKKIFPKAKFVIFYIHISAGFFYSK